MWAIPPVGTASYGCWDDLTNEENMLAFQIYG
jgi:hypothetical protein